MSDLQVSIEHVGGPKSKEKELVIRIPIREKPSGSGKSTVIATTSGNVKTDLEYNGGKIVIGVNAYIPLKS